MVLERLPLVCTDSILKYTKCGREKEDRLVSSTAGFSMLLVVAGHVDLTNKGNDPNNPIASAIHAVIYSFHMPLFIFISGWLFYFTCIRKEKPYRDVLMSKVKPLLVPFFAFTMVTVLLKMTFPQLVKRTVDMEEIINTFILFRSNPLGEMWFILVLLELMLLYPVYKVIVRNTTFAILGIMASLLVNAFTPPVSFF